MALTYSSEYVRRIENAISAATAVRRRANMAKVTGKAQIFRGAPAGNLDSEASPHTNVALVLSLRGVCI